MLESTTDNVYNGAVVIAENGVALTPQPFFRKGNVVVQSLIDTDIVKPQKALCNTYHISITTNSIVANLGTTQTYHNRYIDPNPFLKYDPTLAFEIQVHALARRIYHVNAKTAIIGVSGGIDSTLALLVTIATFEVMSKPITNIIAVVMPGFGTTSTTYDNAIQLIKATGVTLKEISIVQSVEQHFEDINQDPNNHDITYENAQARERTQILMDLSNMHQGLVVGTGSMSESALGFATYNGDHISMYNPNGGLPKTLGISILKHFAEDPNRATLTQVLKQILQTPISPELLPPTDANTMSQKTEDILGSYNLNDFFLYYVLHGSHPSKIETIATIAFPEIEGTKIKEHLQNFYTRFYANQYKRSASTDAPNIVGLSLSPRGGFIMPSDAKPI
jgi:NAD+ synthase (glutamine-hydrolysing)